MTELPEDSALYYMARMVCAYAMLDRHTLMPPPFPEVSFMYCVFMNDEKGIISIAKSFLAAAIKLLEVVEGKDGVPTAERGKDG